MTRRNLEYERVVEALDWNDRRLSMAGRMHLGLGTPYGTRSTWNENGKCFKKPRNNS